MELRKYTTNLENSGVYCDVVLYVEHMAAMETLQKTLDQSNLMLLNARDQRDKAFKDADKAETKLAEVLDDTYVAWLRWIGTGSRRRLSVCNSADTGAFKVYRHPKTCDQELSSRMQVTA